MVVTPENKYIKDHRRYGAPSAVWGENIVWVFVALDAITAHHPTLGGWTPVHSSMHFP